MTETISEINEQVSAEPPPSFWQSIWQAVAPDWYFILSELLRPIPILLLGFSLVLLIVQAFLAHTTSTNNTSAVSLNLIATLVVSVATSILGAIVYDRWKQIQEQNILASKGKSAIRGLNLLLRATRNQRRLLDEHKDYIGRSNEIDLREFELMLRELEQSSSDLSTHLVGAQGFQI